MFFVRLLSASGKRLTKSLETKDAVVAAKRARQAFEELQAEVNEGLVKSRWDSDQVGVEWDIPLGADGRLALSWDDI